MTDEAVVLLVRHARAGDPAKWPGPDGDRPLDERGERQAAQIAVALSPYRPARVISAPPLRCRQTVAGIADATGLPVEIDPLFGEDDAPPDPERRLLEVAAPGAVVVVCSQGGVIPRTLAALGVERDRIRAPKGSVWRLTLREGRLVAASDDVLPG